MSVITKYLLAKNSSEYWVMDIDFSSNGTLPVSLDSNVTVGVAVEPDDDPLNPGNNAIYIASQDSSSVKVNSKGNYVGDFNLDNNRNNFRLRDRTLGGFNQNFVFILGTSQIYTPGARALGGSNDLFVGLGSYGTTHGVINYAYFDGFREFYYLAAPSGEQLILANAYYASSASPRNIAITGSVFAPTYQGIFVTKYNDIFPTSPSPGFDFSSFSWQRVYYPSGAISTSSFFDNATLQDSSGNIYVIGTRVDGSGNITGHFARLTSAGAVSLVRDHDYLSGMSWIDGTINTSNVIYLAGADDNLSDFRPNYAIVARVTSSGSFTWAKRFYVSGERAAAVSIINDSSSNLYVLCQELNSSGDYTSVLILKLNSSGSLVASRRIALNSGYFDMITSIEGSRMFLDTSGAEDVLVFNLTTFSAAATETDAILVRMPASLDVLGVYGRVEFTNPTVTTSNISISNSSATFTSFTNYTTGITNLTNSRISFDPDKRVSFIRD